MSEVKQFSIDICKESAKQALIGAIEQAKQYRYEFLTPEVLLYHIVQQPEFINFCKEKQIDYNNIANELSQYNDSQDRIPEDEEYQCMLSSQLSSILGKVNEQYEYTKNRIAKDKKIDLPPDAAMIDSADLLWHIISIEDDSIAKSILEKYFGENHMLLMLKIKLKYLNIKLPDNSNQESIPIKAEAYIDGKKIDLGSVDPEKLLDGLMSSTGELMQKLKNIQQRLANGGNDSSNEADIESDSGTRHKTSGRQQHEPWMDFVTCTSHDAWRGIDIVGRTKELDRCIRILCRKDKNNPIFIGEPGVGKTALIYRLAFLIKHENVPACLKNAKIYSMDMASMVAGTAIHGEFEKRIKTVLEGASRRGNCILYIDEIHNICDANGGNQSISAAEMMKPYLEDGSIRIIGSTTYKDYNKSIANRKALARRFSLIDIKEPSIDETVQILQKIKFDYEYHHDCKFTDEALRYAVEQSAALIHDRFLPDKAIEIMDEAGAYRQQNPRINKKGEPMAQRFQKVDVDIVKHVLTEVCRIDAKAMASHDNTELKDLDKRLSNEIYGQDEAIRQVVRSVMMSKAGLMEPDKPIASMLFVGPTGVGKTEICKVLAKELGIELVRFDMSEYTEKHTISKLIGTPAGYVGYDDGGLLTDAIRKTPNCVLLLDEIEKAHSDIYNILLQVMDYAKLTDSKGNKADFRNVILVMTSNAGAQYAGQASIGFGAGMSKGQAMLTTVKKTFKPEFLNRLSCTVVFNDMDKTMASMILDKKLGQLLKRLESKHVTFTLTDEAKNFLLTKGFNAQYGGREMDRAIQQHLTPLLMDEILFGKLAKGGNATVTLKNDALSI